MFEYTLNLCCSVGIHKGDFLVKKLVLKLFGIQIAFSINFKNIKKNNTNYIFLNSIWSEQATNRKTANKKIDSKNKSLSRQKAKNKKNMNRRMDTKNKNVSRAKDFDRKNINRRRDTKNKNVSDQR